MADLVGRHLSHYVIESSLGQGGMGEVYRAVDTRLRRPVAIKVLSEAIVSPSRRERFLREAQAASALNHPGIVTIYDVGHADGHDFIVMELVQGRTLQSVIAAGPLGVEQVLDYARQAASALGTAHSAGIVHRDLKPQNLMITDAGQLKVLDFGLAHVDSGETDSLSPTQERLTALGLVVGTPGYMSPEQAEGRSVDARSDVFSLGIVLYEALTGRLPFRSTSVAGVLYEIVHRDPEPLRRVRPDLPADVESVLDVMLRKDPGRRYANGAEVVAALGGPATGRRPPRPGRPRADRWLRRHKAPVAAAAILAAVAGAALLSPIRSRLARIVPAGAPAPAESGSPFSLYRQGTEALARFWERGRIEEATDRFRRAIALDAGYAPAYVGLAEATWRAYRRDEDPAQIKQALAHARQAVEKDGQLAIAHATLGLVALEAGEMDEARRALDKALALDPASARAHRALARLLKSEGRPAEAEAAFGRAVAAAPEDWDLRVSQGAFFHGAGRYAEAEAAFREAARLSPDNPVPWRNLGGAQHMRGHFADAAASLQKSLEIAPDALVYSNLGTIYFFEGLYPQAVAAFEKAVELSPNTGVIWRNLADAYRTVPGRETDSRGAYTRAAQLAREQLERQPGDAAARAELALCLARLGHPEEALREVALVEAAADADPATLYAIAQACESAGARDRALANLARALESGYSVSEVRRDVELVELRKDIRYHRLVVRYEGDGRSPSPGTPAAPRAPR